MGKHRAGLADPVGEVLDGSVRPNGLQLTRVRVPLGKARAGVLVPEEAVLSDQGVRYLYAVGADNKAVRLDVTPGVLDGGLRVIEAVRGPTDAAPRPLAADEPQRGKPQPGRRGSSRRRPTSGRSLTR